MYPNPTFRRSAGFSLLEVFLALGLALSLTGLTINRIKTDSENAQARAVGEQASAVADALNSYIALRINQIRLATNVAGAGTANDPGPRTCQSGGGAGIVHWCSITSDTLRRNGLLPLSFTGQNAYGALYNYYIRVSGTAPDYNVDGMVMTDTPYVLGGTIPRYDLLGEAMLRAGADAGITRASTTEFEGLNGGWLEAGYGTMMAAVAGQSLEKGLLGVRAGYGSSGYANYMRSDGGNPMTGNLDMGGHNIQNALDITATNKIQGLQLVGTKIGITPALVLGDTATNNTTTFQQNSNALTLNNTGGVTLKNGSNLGALAVGSLNLGTGTTTTAGLTASGSNVVVSNNGSIVTTGTGGVSSGGNLYTGGTAFINGTMTVNGTATLGGSCGSVGLIARDGTQILQCRNGTWRVAALGTTYTTSSASYSCSANALLVAYCAAGYKAISGGFQSIGSPTGTWNTPVSSAAGYTEGISPGNDATSWFIRNAPTSPGCFQAYVVCAPN